MNFIFYGITYLLSFDNVSSLNWQMRNSNNKCMLEIDGVFLFDRKQLFQ